MLCRSKSSVAAAQRKKPDELASIVQDLTTLLENITPMPQPRPRPSPRPLSLRPPVGCHFACRLQTGCCCVAEVRGPLLDAAKEVELSQRSW